MQLNIGQNVKEQLESDLRLEIDAVGMYNRAVQTAQAEGEASSIARHCAAVLRGPQ